MKAKSGKVKSRVAEGAPEAEAQSEGSSGIADLEVELAVYRQALERARADMQAFAYSVSHDLRAPLRAIQGFSKILLEDFGGELNDEAQQFLKHIIHNTQTLAGQMDDLLRFSRAGKNAPTKITIETGPFVRELMEQLRPDLPKNFKAEVGDLPEIWADPVLMRQALTELIQNAAKFSGNTAEPRAEIFGRQDEHAVTIGVRDNGVGFDPAYAGKLFQVFQKLHSQAEFPGYGIGLALVKRIVEAHGGCAEAEAEPDKGATFYIALPLTGAKTPLECVPRVNGAVQTA